MFQKWLAPLALRGHAFLCDGDHPIASFFTRPILDVDAVRDADDREKAWEIIFAFFAKHT